MSILHGSWIFHPLESYLFVWGEAWQSLGAEKAANHSLSVPSHPFCSTVAELVKLLPRVNKYEETFQVLTLPSYSAAGEKNLLPLLSNQSLEEGSPQKSLALRPWQISGVKLKGWQALHFLARLPLSSLSTSESNSGADLQFWAHCYRWSLDLLARGKFVPALMEQPQVRSCWYPLLDSTIDQSRFATFSQTIPPVCRSYSESEVEPLILDFLRNAIDIQVRHFNDNNPTFSKNLIVQTWLKSLIQPAPQFELGPKQLQRLGNAFYNWTLPIQENLVTDKLGNFGKNYRVCLKLQPPKEGDLENWRLSYGIQALDDAEFLIGAEHIWTIAEERFIYKNRIIDNPQEILLKGLGIAAKIYTPVKSSLQESQPTGCNLDPIQVYEFIKAIAWQFEDQGLGISLPQGLAPGLNEQRLGIKIEAKVTPKKGERLNLKSLINYELKLIVGEETISEKELNDLLSKKSPIVEVNGQWLMLQPADVRAAQAILSNKIDPLNLSVEDALRLSSDGHNVIAKLPVVKFEASGILRELINAINNNEAIQLIQQPKTFNGELRPYQIKGVSWLSFLEKWGLGACLADDMGLGKTLQLIALLLVLKEQDMLTGPVLVVCPTSVVNNWEREVRKFAPGLSITVHHGEKRAKGKAFSKAIEKKDLVITSYSLVFRDANTLEAIDWRGVVLDEAQNIKNSAAKQSQSVRKLKAGFKIALTGTPVENRLSELWSILDFLNPEFLGNATFFQRRFAIPIEKYGDKESLNSLRSLVRPFILRRLKTDKTIIQDLPDKQEMNVFCGLSAEQAQIYQKLVEDSLVQIDSSDGIQRHGLILTLLMQLKQVCNHPGHFLKEKVLNSANRSGKLLRLQEMLEELVEEGARALIFTQFAEWGKLLQPYLTKTLDREVIFLYGSTPQKERVKMVDRFQSDPNGPPIFILSLKAGGTGLNLTRANHVFHVDRWWNPAVENQATDRAFRIGQKQNVQVHKFISTGTLEEKINDIIESKKQLADQTIDAGENWLTQLDTNQLRNLLLLDRSRIIDEEEV
ncbi:MAG: RNA polymerase-associated protein RapA [Chroococcopsis gigantea SAG 12.99]|jgi:SNF2 family DNA or RNA helicase|nr:DEAD/DEAH box helicase [Chlorogloea purpurea SAG 13.99]MDV2998440.1 RNA polymerase-associated protein RapA [Chroococcopsis gigantea SAG 12.99]